MKGPRRLRFVGGPLHGKECPVYSTTWQPPVVIVARLGPIRKELDAQNQVWEIFVDRQCHYFLKGDEYRTEDGQPWPESEAVTK